MLTQRTDVTFTTPGLPNIFPYPMRLGANLVAWWSAESNVTLSGGSNVTQWQDRTQYATKVVNAGSPNPIVLTPNAQNGLPGLATSQTVAGQNAFLNSGGTSAGLDQCEYNVPWNVSLALKVGAFTGTEANHQLLGYCSANALQGWSLTTRNTSTSIWNFYLYQGNGLVVISLQSNSGMLQPGSTGTFTVTYNGSGVATGLAFYVNGVKVSQGTVASTLIASLLAPSRLVRMFMINTQNSPDTLYEAVVTTGLWTQSQVTLMDQYLNQKWALHL